MAWLWPKGGAKPRVFFYLAMPTLVGLVADPLAALADTLFVAKLGADDVAGLGVTAALLGLILWSTHFLAVSSQTDVARALAKGEHALAQACATSTLRLGLLLGLALAGLGWLLLDLGIAWMEASKAVAVAARRYGAIRLLGLPAMVAVWALLGSLRGAGRTPAAMGVAALIAGLNAAIDPVFIFGFGDFAGFGFTGLGFTTGLGIAGAAWATVLSQWVGFGVGFVCLKRADLIAAGWLWAAKPKAANKAEFQGNWSLVARTGVLLLFLALLVRRANALGEDIGAGHQILRQLWMLVAFFLDAFASAGQTLAAGATTRSMREVRAIAQQTLWVSVVAALGVGGLVWAVWLFGEGSPLAFGLPSLAWPGPWPAWLWTVVLGSVAFATDGILWGVSDYRFGQYAMLLATGVCLWGALWAPDLSAMWGWTCFWLVVRGVLGCFRIFVQGGDRGPYNDAIGFTSPTSPTSQKISP